MARLSYPITAFAILHIIVNDLRALPTTPHVTIIRGC